jgi:hypothetical protein
MKQPPDMLEVETWKKGMNKEERWFQRVGRVKNMYRIG